MLGTLPRAAALVLILALAAFAQNQLPIHAISAKQTFPEVTRTSTGDFWASAQPAANFMNAVLHIVPGGTAIATSCRLAVVTGPTAATATALVDHPNSIIDCTGGPRSVAVDRLNSYFNVKLATLAGGTSPNVTLTVTLIGDGGPRYDAQPVKTITAAVAGARAELVAAPATGEQVYIDSVLVEKVSGAATFTLTYGTGTSCGTGTTTVLGPVTNPQIGLNPLGLKIPAAKALCLETDGANTSVRALVK
jgi:hypothetical protein